LDLLVGYQGAGLAERIIVSHWVGGAKNFTEPGAAIAEAARMSRPETQKKTADSTKNYRKVWKRSEFVPVTFRPNVSNRADNDLEGHCLQDCVSIRPETALADSKFPRVVVGMLGSWPRRHCTARVCGAQRQIYLKGICNRKSGRL
jgi:hypothetical protein